MKPICRICDNKYLIARYISRHIRRHDSNWRRRDTHEVFLSIRKEKLKWNFQSIYDLKTFSFYSGNQETINILIYAAPEVKKGLHASIKKHCWCSLDMCARQGRKWVVWNEDNERDCSGQQKKVPFASCQKHLCRMRMWERHLNLLKMENQWRKKVDTKIFSFYKPKKNVRDGELKISRDTILITLGLITIYNNFTNFFFFFYLVIHK